MSNKSEKLIDAVASEYYHYGCSQGETDEGYLARVTARQALSAYISELEAAGDEIAKEAEFARRFICGLWDTEYTEQPEVRAWRKLRGG